MQRLRSAWKLRLNGKLRLTRRLLVGLPPKLTRRTCGPEAPVFFPLGEGRGGNGAERNTERNTESVLWVLRSMGKALCFDLLSDVILTGRMCESANKEPSLSSCGIVGQWGGGSD